MRSRRRCEEPRLPQGEGIFEQIVVSVATDFFSGIIEGVVLPKIKRLFGEEDTDCDCSPPTRAP
jgi:hypothetical protein